MSLREKCLEYDFDYRKALILYSVLPIQDTDVLDILENYDYEFTEMFGVLCKEEKGYLLPICSDDNIK